MGYSSKTYIIRKADKEKAQREGKSLKEIVREREQKHRASKSKSKVETVKATPGATDVVAYVVSDPSFKGRTPDTALKIASKNIEIVEDSRPIILPPEYTQERIDALDMINEMSTPQTIKDLNAPVYGKPHYDNSAEAIQLIQQQSTPRTIEQYNAPIYGKQLPQPFKEVKVETDFRPTSPEETIRTQTTIVNWPKKPLPFLSDIKPVSAPKVDYQKQYTKGLQSISEDYGLFVSNKYDQSFSKLEAIQKKRWQPIENFTLLTSRKQTIMPDEYKKAESKVSASMSKFSDTTIMGSALFGLAASGVVLGVKDVADTVIYPKQTVEGFRRLLNNTDEVFSQSLQALKNDPFGTSIRVATSSYVGGKVWQGGKRIISNTVIVPLNKRFNTNYMNMDKVFAFEKGKYTGVGKTDSFTRKLKKVEAFRSKITGRFAQSKPLELNPIHTDPIPTGRLIKQFGGRNAITVHATDSPAFKFDASDMIELKSNPAMAKGFRKKNDMLSWYRSLPTDKGNPQAYLAYMSDISPIDYESSIIRGSWIKGKRQVLFEDVGVKYRKPKKGESVLSYSERINQFTGETMIPAENIFGMSIERQVVTPSGFTGVRGKVYKSSILKKKAETGFTYYAQGPEKITDGGYINSLKKAVNYYRTDFKKINLVEVETVKMFGPSPASKTKATNKILDLDDYAKSYGTKTIYPSDFKGSLVAFSRSTSLSPSRSSVSSLMRKMEQSSASLKRSLSSSTKASSSTSLSRSLSRSKNPFSSSSASSSFSRSLSRINSPSKSPSKSPSRSRSASLSSSPSRSPSPSPSPSWSLSPSPSPSRSPSPSWSPSRSRSRSPSRSPSPSWSRSPSPSPSPTPFRTPPPFKVPLLPVDDPFDRKRYKRNLNYGLRKFKVKDPMNMLFGR